MKNKAEEQTLSRHRTVLPFRRAFRPINAIIVRPYGIQKIEFEGDPDVPWISYEDFREREFTTHH